MGLNHAGTLYRDIDDWTPAGRQALVKEHEWEIRALLDEMFTTLDQDYDLAPFGWHSEAPIEEAVQWCIDRFTRGDIDPARLHQGSRSFRLFTEGHFWLAQKVGKGHLAACMARARRNTSSRRDDLSSKQPAVGGGTVHEIDEPGDLGQAPASHQERVVNSLERLFRRTCASMVGYWLEATRGIRASWYGQAEAEERFLEHPLTKSARSKYRHDATFRFQCLHLGFVRHPAAPTGTALRAVEEALFAPCADRPPFRVADRQALVHLKDLRPRPAGSREVTRLRKRGSASLLLMLKAFVTGEDPVKAPDSNLLHHDWDRLLALHALSRTTLHALDLENEPELALSLEPLWAKRTAARSGVES